jgi:hypothetical protein
MRWAGHVEKIGKNSNACSLLVGKPERRRPLRRPRSRLVDDIKIDLGEMVWTGVVQDWQQWGSLVNALMNIPVPSNSRKFLSSAREALSCPELV